MSFGSIGASSNITVTAEGVLVDDTAFTPASSKVLPSGFVFDDAAPDSVNEGDAGAGRMSGNRCQYVIIRDAAGNERGLNIDALGRLTITSSPVVYSKANITSATTVTPKSGPGVFHGLVINKAVVSGVITIYDNTAASGAIIGTITFGVALLSDPPIQALYDVNVTTGITIVTSAAFDITVMYQ